MLIWAEQFRSAIGAAAVVSAVATVFISGAMPVTVLLVCLWLITEDL
jgi:hypothetical protein